MTYRKSTRTAVVAALCAAVGAAAGGIATGSAATSTKSNTSSAQRARPPGPPGGLAVHSDEVVLNRAGTAFISATEDPIIQCHDRLDFYQSEVVRRSLADWFTPRNLLLLFAAALVVASGWFGRYPTAQIPTAVVASIALVRALARKVGLSLGSPGGAEWAVGWANYDGYPKSAEFNLFAVCLACCALAGVAVGLLARRRDRRIASPQVEPTPQAPGRWARLGR